MTRAIPIIPTILVLAAVGVMVWLGIWQLGRADEKAALIASYELIDADETPLRFSPDSPPIEDWEAVYFHSVALECPEVTETRSTAGTHANGAKGWTHIVRCAGSGLEAVLGWSRDPVAPFWEGGSVRGVMDQNGKIVADPPLAGLEPLAKPDPNDLPNNHLSYAVQWFLFALTAFADLRIRRA